MRMYSGDIPDVEVGVRWSKEGYQAYVSSKSQQHFAESGHRGECNEAYQDLINILFEAWVLDWGHEDG
jgi:hypothetical protein